MKHCPHCAEEIQDAAKSCKHCGKNLRAFTFGSLGQCGCLAAIILFILLFVPLGRLMQQTGERPATAATEQLELLSTNGYHTSTGSHVIVEGEVKNITAGPLKNVQAVATWYTKTGEMVSSDDALVKYNPIMPGQTSPFKVIGTGNPLATNYRIAFKELFGGTVGTKDSRKASK